MKRILTSLAVLTLLFAIACSKSESTTASSAPAAGETATSTSPPATEESAQAAASSDDPVATSTAITAAEIADAPRIAPQRAWELVQSGQAVIVDVRGKDQYDSERIKGSVSIPLWELESRARSELEPTRWIIPYCT